MKPRALISTAGAFSLINENLCGAMRQEMPDHEWGAFDAVKDLVRGRPVFHCLATFQALLEFPSQIFSDRIPPRDLMVRLPFFQRHLSAAVKKASAGCRFTFQTQSLFDASAREIPHFLYTDHTFLANRRYHPPRKTWPASAGWLATEAALYRHSKVCFTSSQFAADSLMEDYRVDPCRVMVVGSGCNIPVPDSPPRRERPPRRIIFLGVEWERKGGPVLVEALRTIRKSFPDASLDVVGCAPRISQPGVAIHGRIPRTQVGGHLEKADIFCLPSLAEPSASALVEAAAFALPVVATLVGGTPGRVRHGETGCLVEAGNAPALATALMNLMSHPDEARRLGLAGRLLVQREFTWQATAHRMAARIAMECP